MPRLRHTPRPFASALRRLGVLVALACAVTLLTPNVPAALAQDDAVVIDGRGNGHGRGMSQWGALGYALGGVNAGAILDHYYGGTTPGWVPNRALGVLLTGHNGLPSVTLRHDRGLLRTNADGGVGAYAALQFRLEGGTWRLYAGSDCGGPWTHIGDHGNQWLTVDTWDLTGDVASSVQVCEGDRTRYYRGHINTFNVGGSLRVVNVVAREDYLRGVVPLEVSASWWNLGGGRGAEAIYTQAIAARSYAEAGDSRWASVPADTCDTTQCQVYGGRGYNKDGTYTSVEHPSTDEGIRRTADQVRIRNGVVARTEFHSSSGGHTAGGDFPAVPDFGDSYSGNPVHRWSTTVPVASIETAYGLGSLLGMDVLATNGLGDDGGRVTSLRLRFTGGNTTVTGAQFRSQFGLRSDWFRPGGPVFLRTYVNAAYETLLGRPADAGGAAFWSTAIFNGLPRGEFALALARTPEWVSNVVGGQYQKILGRAPDGGGLGYWSEQLRTGNLRVAGLAANLYASDEFYSNAGGDDGAWVDGLYQNIFGRAPDGAGRDYWIGQLASGTPRQVIANALFLSYESNVQRVDALYTTVLGRAPDAAGRDYWGRQLTTLDDINLAALLVASDEFFANAQNG